MKKFFLILAATLIIGGSTCAAEDLKFIDAMGDTGYYYDADSVKIAGSSVIYVKMAVIKANFNRMYTYDIQITHPNRVYEILSSKILSCAPNWRRTTPAARPNVTPTNPRWGKWCA